MLKLSVIFLSILFTGITSWAGSVADEYNSLNCAMSPATLQKRVELSLSKNNEAVIRRMNLAGFKGESLGKILDVNVQCISSAPSFERSDRVLISAYFQVRNNICRFQFATDTSRDESDVLDFDYIHCIGQ